MEIGIVIVAVVVAMVMFYCLIMKMIDTKMKTYSEAILKYQHTISNHQLEHLSGLTGKVDQLGTGMTNLERSLGNVKTRGIYGEWQLGSILQELMRKEQYETECMVIPGSTKRVEYAVKMPGYGGQTVYLPIDSKFPLDAYLQLHQAKEQGDEEVWRDARDLFASRVKRFAKEIHDKYVKPPFTTDFAIMFLPFEGIYIEVLQLGLMEELMKNYKITIAGPSTLAAILNSLQVGFRSVALEEKSAEIWEALSGAKSEVDRFETTLLDLQKRQEQMQRELEQLVGVRTRKLKKSLEYFEQGREDS